MLGHCYSYSLGPSVQGWKKGLYDDEFPAFDPARYDRTYALVRNPFALLVSYYYHNDHLDALPEGQCGWLNCFVEHGANIKLIVHPRIFFNHLIGIFDKIRAVLPVVITDSRIV